MKPLPPYLQEFDPKHFKDAISLQVPATWEPVVTQAIKEMITLEPEIEIMQIKSKFNELRIYYAPYNETLEVIVRRAQQEVPSLF